MDTESQIIGNSIFGSLPVTIFESMSLLAQKHQSINLGQGFPDTELEGPSSMKTALFKSVTECSNQYPPMMGIPELREAIARHSKEYSNILVDWSKETLVTVGATEALAASFLGLLNPGDEVIVFSPLYDSYSPMIKRAGGTPIIIPLQPPHWNINYDQLASAFTDKTKLIVINTPHNPTGKVFTREELTILSHLLLEHSQVVAILDEVYQHLVYPNSVHISLRELDGMHNRCIRIGSAGKSFSFTDFKVGWCTGPNTLIHAVAKAHQFLIFTVNSGLQRSVAHGLDNEKEFYTGLGELLSKKRQVLADRLTSIGFDILPAHGTYFLVADFKPLLPLLTSKDEGETSKMIEKKEMDDVEFCFRLTREAGVTLIPVSAFYVKKGDAPKTLVRFVFCKTEEKLDAACARLETYFGGMRKMDG